MPLVEAAGETVMTVPLVREITSGEAAVLEGDNALTAAAVAVAIAVAATVGDVVGAVVADATAGVADEPPLPEHAETGAALLSSSAVARREKRDAFIASQVPIAGQLFARSQFDGLEVFSRNNRIARNRDSSDLTSFVSLRYANAKLFGAARLISSTSALGSRGIPCTAFISLND